MPPYAAAQQFTVLLEAQSEATVFVQAKSSLRSLVQDKSRRLKRSIHCQDAHPVCPLPFLVAFDGAGSRHGQGGKEVTPATAPFHLPSALIGLENYHDNSGHSIPFISLETSLSVWTVSGDTTGSDIVYCCRVVDCLRPAPECASWLRI